MSRPARRQRGSVAVETALLLPALLTAAMMAFEVVRYALVLIVGGLALNSALGGLRRYGDAALSATGNPAAIIKADLLTAAYGYLDGADIVVRATRYASLSALGGTGADADRNPDFPVFTVEVELTQDWITALPTFLGLPGRFSHAYRQVWGTQYRPERRPS